jgi:membrane protease YdiL (CAAX protease family)
LANHLPIDSVSPSDQPSNVRRIVSHPILQILAYFCGVILIGILVGGILFVYVKKEVIRYGLLFAYEMGMEAFAAVTMLALLLRFEERRRLRDAGFTVRGVVSETTAGAMIGMAVMSVTIGALAAFGIYRETGADHNFRPWIPLTTFLFVAIAEETMFRGVVFRLLEQRYGSLIALIVGCLIFGLLHVTNEGGEMPLWEKLTGPTFISFEAGLLLTAAYMATRRLWLPIGIHWAWNYFEGPVYGTSVSGTDMGGPPLLKATVRGPFLLSGGSFGPEASVICLIVCTLAGLLLLRIAVRAGQWRQSPAAFVGDPTLSIGP